MQRIGLAGPLFRRLAVAALTVLGVAAATFLVLSAAPGDPLSAWVSPEEQQLLSPAEVQTLRARLGLDRPVWVQCVRWCGGLLSGDLGRSFQTRLPVSAEIGARLWPTVELNLTAFLLVTLIGAPLGWWAAWRRGGRFDRWSSVVLLVLYAAALDFGQLCLPGSLAYEQTLAWMRAHCRGFRNHVAVGFRRGNMR